jgi:hypothetical protein
MSQSTEVGSDKFHTALQEQPDPSANEIKSLLSTTGLGCTSIVNAGGAEHLF